MTKMITGTVVIEWTAAICIGLLGFVILLPRIFLRHRMSVPLFPLQRQNQSGRLNVGYREIASKNGVVSVWYPCERTGSERRHDKVISTTVNVGKIMYSMTGIKLFLFHKIVPPITLEILTNTIFDAPHLNRSDGLSRDLVILVHDNLGSRLDFAHLAVALASEGFVVGATDSYNSILQSSSSPSHHGKDALDQRVRDTQCAIHEIRSRFEVRHRVGLLGHGHGAEVVTSMKSNFKESYARIAIAGLYLDIKTQEPYDCVLKEPFLPILGELDGITSEWTVVPHLGKRSAVMVPNACRMSFRCHAMCRFLRETLVSLFEIIPSYIVEDCAIDIANYNHKGGRASEVSDFILPYVFRFLVANLRKDDDVDEDETI